LQNEVAPEFKALKERLTAMTDTYEAAINLVKEHGNQEVQDILARRLYDMTGGIVMSLLLMDDATRAPELFSKSLNVYVRMIEADVNGHMAFIQNFRAEDVEYYRAMEQETAVAE